MDGAISSLSNTLKNIPIYTHSLFWAQKGEGPTPTPTPLAYQIIRPSAPSDRSVKSASG
jgi:hypothetical protein